ncbi:hypothetical protein J6590_088918 [Homalodisca vitripennis]|nr:hypothetical protein J6590_088918 [Homalodisca vitripennis]
MVGSTNVEEQCEVSKCNTSEHDIGVLSVFSYTGWMVGSTKVEEQCEVSKCDTSEHDIEVLSVFSYTGWWEVPK